MKRHPLILCAALLISLVALAPALAAEPASYTLVFIKTGPKSGQLPEAENKAAFAGHFANMKRLAAERKLLVAGPFGEQRHDPNLRGLFVLNTAESGVAHDWAESDPTTQAGIFVLEYHRLQTAAPLAAALERGLASEEKARHEGRELGLEESMRSYVWLIAEEREKARDALAPLLEQGRIFLLADLDDTKLIALLDAEVAEAARKTYADALGRLGNFTLDDWYGSKELAEAN